MGDLLSLWRWHWAHGAASDREDLSRGLKSDTGGVLTPTGSVDFYDGGVLLGSGALSSGTAASSSAVATLWVSGLAAGAHALQAWCDNRCREQCRGVVVRRRTGWGPARRRRSWHLRAADGHGAGDDDRALHGERWVSALEGTDVPIAFVWGMLDPVSGAHIGQRIRERLPDAPFLALEDVGHWPALEAPERVVAAVAERAQ